MEGFYIERDDLRQTYVVAKNEAYKFVKGKRFLVYIAFMAVIFCLVTLIPYALGDNPGETKGEVITNYLMFVDGLALIAAALFASITLVSEYEERTALILFTRPIKKTTIFIGKFVACFALEAAMVIVYYLLTVGMSFALVGDVSSNIPQSLGVAMTYLFAASGIAVLISALLKKSGVATVMTFLILLVIIPLVSQVMQSVGGIDTWFIIDSNHMLHCIPDYVETVNNSFGDIISEMVVDFVKYVPPGRSALVGIAWGGVSCVAAWGAFLKKEF